jgi:hypothetical protein
MQRLRPLVLAVAAFAFGGAAHSQTPPGLPTEIPQVRFNAGQSIVPYYEGWIRNRDGSFDLVFGYFNRNYRQELAIAAGPENKVEPGPADQGQPTYFLPRRQRFIYRVRVPASFGNGVVTWTITANGRTEKAFGDLIPPEEITERVVATNGNFDPGLDDPNKPPTLEISVASRVAANTAVMLKARVTDDGLPKPRPIPQPTPQPTATGDSRVQAQVNTSGRGRLTGVRVTYLQLRGPAKAILDQTGPIPAVNGEATASVRFTAPGAYTLLVSATDGAISTRKELTFTVVERLNTEQ